MDQVTQATQYIPFDTLVQANSYAAAIISGTTTTSDAASYQTVSFAVPTGYSVTTDGFTTDSHQTIKTTGSLANNRYTISTETVTADGTVAPSAETVTIQFIAGSFDYAVSVVDDDAAGKQLATVTKTGTVGSTATFDTETDLATTDLSNYVLASVSNGAGTATNQTVGGHSQLVSIAGTGTLMIDTDPATGNIIIHLTHRMDVTSATSTETISYQNVPTGTNITTPTTQQISWTVTTDAVTGDVTYTAENATFAAIKPQTITGHQLQIRDHNGYLLVNSNGQPLPTIPAATLSTPSDQTYTVSYTAAPVTLLINYVDSDVRATTTTQAEVTAISETASGTYVFGQMGTYQPTIPAVLAAKYQLASTAGIRYTLSADKTTLTVELVHRIVDQTAAESDVTTTRQIIYSGYPTDSSDTAPTNQAQVIHWSTSTDLATGVVTYIPLETSYSAVTATIPAGYHATVNGQDSSSADTSALTAVTFTGSTSDQPQDPEIVTVSFEADAPVDDDVAYDFSDFPQPETDTPVPTTMPLVMDGQLPHIIEAMHYEPRVTVKQAYRRIVDKAVLPLNVRVHSIPRVRATIQDGTPPAADNHGINNSNAVVTNSPMLVNPHVALDGGSDFSELSQFFIAIAGTVNFGVTPGHWQDLGVSI